MNHTKRDDVESKYESIWNMVQINKLEKFGAENFASLLMAIYVDTKLINAIAIAVFPGITSLMSSIYMSVMFLLLVVSFFFQHKSITDISQSQFLIALLCFFWYWFTFIFIGDPSVKFSFFTVFCLFPLLLPSLVNIDIKKTLIYIMILTSWGVFFTDSLFIKEIEEHGNISMGLSYAILIPVIATITYLFFYFKYEKMFYKIIILPFVLCNLFYLGQLFMWGSRGPALSVLLLLIILFTLKKNNYGIQFNYTRFVGVSALCITIVVSFIPFLIQLNELLNKYDISMYVIDKFLKLNMDGDLTNGRISVIDSTINGIIDYPFLGHGISRFLANTGEVYPHNFILQTLYDGGIVLFLLIFIPVIAKFIKIYKIVPYKILVWLIFLSFASVPGALFSGDMWNSNVLWLLIGTITAIKLKGKMVSI